MVQAAAQRFCPAGDDCIHRLSMAGQHTWTKLSKILVLIADKYIR